MSEPTSPGFVSRWSQRKSASRQGVALPEPAPEPASPQAASSQAKADAAPAPTMAPPPGPVAPPGAPAPTLDEAEQLTAASDFRRFVAQGVDPGVKNIALKKLFADPHFNLMDGLDVYIDDYGKPDPLPADQLRRMAQSAFLGLPVDDPPPPPLPPLPDAQGLPPDTAPTPVAADLPDGQRDDEDTAVRLQPDDVAGPAGDCPLAGDDPRREP